MKPSRPDWFIRIARNCDLESETDDPSGYHNLRRIESMITSKPAWQSKTLWASLIVAALPFVPGLGPVATAWIAANPELYAAALGGLFAGLRAVTDGRVSIR